MYILLLYLYVLLLYLCRVIKNENIMKKTVDARELLKEVIEIAYPKTAKQKEFEKRKGIGSNFTPKKKKR